MSNKFTTVIAPHNPTPGIDDTHLDGVRYVDTDGSVYDTIAFAGGLNFCSQVRDTFAGEGVGYIGLAYVSGRDVTRLVAGSFKKM